MPAPDPYVVNKNTGRRGSAVINVNWTAQENSDQDEAIILDPTQDLDGTYFLPSFAITKVQWRSATALETVLKFDAVGDGSEILTIPEGEQFGEETFDNINGCIPDPDRSAPSNIVMNTNGALSTDRLYIRLEYKVHGTRPH